MNLGKGNIPLYFQFYLKMKRDIILGEIPAGSRIPSIEALYDHHDVSHGTIRKALDLLEHEGLIRKKPGAGIFVRENLNLTMWSPGYGLDDFGDRMANYHFQQLSDDWIQPPKRIQAAFESDKNLFDQKVFYLKWLQVGKNDDSRRVFNEAYIPAWFLAELSAGSPKNDPRELYREIRNRQPIGAEQILRPWFCDHEVAQHLQRPGGTPVFQRTLIPYLSGKKAVAYIEQLTTAPSLHQYIAAPDGTELEE